MVTKGEFQIWLQEFLNKDSRRLEFPDGRSLFQYRMNSSEFLQLHSILVTAQIGASNHTSYKNHTERLFVLYAAEWWRRNYSGGRWKWKIITDSLDWECPPHVKRSEIIRIGLKYWKRPVLRYETLGNAYFLSIVLEGGLPIKMLENSGAHLTRYLKALLDDFLTYRGSGISIAKLAEDLDHYLPQGFRRSAVYQLAAKITECIDSLSGSLESRGDPSAELDRSRPGWQSELPIELNNDNARILVNGLLLQAKVSRARGGSRLRFQRIWAKADNRWSQRVTLVLPATISPAQLAQAINGDVTAFSDRMELTMEGGGEVRKVASLVKSDDSYSVFMRERSRLDLPIRCNERVTCTLNAASRYIAEVAVDGDEPVEHRFPLVLSLIEGRDEMELIGQGGLTTRRPEVVVVIPEGCSVMDLEGESGDVEGLTSAGRLLSLRGRIRLAMPDGLECIIRTSADRDSENNCRLIGNRLPSLEVAKAKIFSGMPKVVMITLGGTHRPVAEKDILWRTVKCGDAWMRLDRKQPVGEVDLRVLQEGSCVFSNRVSILPEGFKFTLTGDDSATGGVIKVENISGASVGAEDLSWITISPNDRNDACEITCDSIGAARRRVPLKFRWLNGAQSTLVFPFPAVGAAFQTSNAIETLIGEIPIGSLIHATASGVSHNVADKFQLIGTLRADDIKTEVSRCLNFSMPLVDSDHSGVHELPLLRLFNPISELFSFSADLDSKVELEIISKGRQLARLYIGQFEGQLVYSAEEKMITKEAIANSIDGLIEDRGHEDVLLLPLELDTDPLQVKPLHEGLSEGFCRWKIESPTVEFFSPAMAMVSGRRESIRPCVVFDAEYTHNRNVEVSSFKDAWLEADLYERIASLKTCMKELNRNERSWQTLVDHLKIMRHAHPDCLDTCNVVIEEPEVLAGVFLRAGSDYVTTFGEWQNYLPFRWWQIPLDAWKNALDNYKESVSTNTSDEIVKIVMDQKRNELSDLSAGSPLMQVVNECIQHDYFGLPLEGFTKRIVSDDPSAVFESINKDLARKLFAAKADAQWPQGAPRDWWSDRLQSCGVEGVPWIDDCRLIHRQPVLDAIIAQALFTVNGYYPDRDSRVLICAMRDFSPGDFDKMLLTAQALFYKLQ